MTRRLVRSAVFRKGYSLLSNMQDQSILKAWEKTSPTPHNQSLSIAKDINVTTYISLFNPFRPVIGTCGYGDTRYRSIALFDYLKRPVSTHQKPPVSLGHRTR
jgi:hypothetical protein